MSHTDELEEYDAELELRLKREYADVFPLFRYCVLTQEATYLCNRFERDFMPQASYPFFHITMEDVWVWDKNRPTRIIPKVEIYTTQDVTVEILKGDRVHEPGEAPSLLSGRGAACCSRSTSGTRRPWPGSTAARSSCTSGASPPSARRRPTSWPPTTTRSCACAAGASGALDEHGRRLGGARPLGRPTGRSVAQVPRPRGAGAGPGRAHRPVDRHRQPARAGRRPHRQRRRRPPAPRRPVHRGGLRHRDQLRRCLGRRRVPGRGHRARASRPRWTR